MGKPKYIDRCEGLNHEASAIVYCQTKHQLLLHREVHVGADTRVLKI